MSDPVAELAHDHAELNYQVIALGKIIETLRRESPDASPRVLAAPLGTLRDQLFAHFAREEEVVFPFASDAAPAFEQSLAAMVIAHDTICGSLSRLVHLATAGADLATLGAIFDRFERAYSEHAATEAQLFRDLATRLDTGQRAALAQLLEALA